MLAWERVLPQIILTRWPDPSLLAHIHPRKYRVTRWIKGAVFPFGKISGRCLLMMAALPSEEMVYFQDSLANFAYRQLQCVVAIDEAHILLRGRTSIEFIRLIRGSRHFGTAIYFATQRLVDLPPDVRTVLTDLFIFRTNSSLDLDWLSREGIPIKSIPTLGLGQYVYVNRITGLTLEAN